MSSDVYYADGRQGGVVLSGTASATGNFRKIKVITDATFDTIVDASLENIEFLTVGVSPLVTIPAGVEFGGNFTSIELASGTVIAYYA